MAPQQLSVAPRQLSRSIFALNIRAPKYLYNDTNNKPGDSAAYWHAFIALVNFFAHLVLPRQERMLYIISQDVWPTFLKVGQVLGQPILNFSV